MTIITSLLLVVGISAITGHILQELLIAAMKKFSKQLEIAPSMKAGISIAFSFFALLALPFPMPQVTLSNGDQTIVVQGMTHIGKVDFYKKVQSDATDYRNQGYVIVHEGIGLNIEEDTNYKCSEEDFNPEIKYIVQPSCLGDLVYGDKVYEPSLDTLESLMINYLSSGSNGSANPYITKEQASEITRFAMDQHSEDTYQVFKPSLLTMTMIKTLFLADSLNTTFIDGRMTENSETYISKEKSKKLVTAWNEIKSDDGERNKRLDKLVIMSASMPEQLTIDYRNKLLGDGLSSLNSDAYVMYGMKHIPGLYAYLKSLDFGWEVTDIKFINSLPWF